MKTGLQDRLRGSQRARVAPDTGPMTGSSNYQQPSTIRGKPSNVERRRLQDAALKVTCPPIVDIR